MKKLFHAGPSITNYQETLYQEVVSPEVSECAVSEPEEVRVGYGVGSGAGSAVGLS
jgi:hypothetical protein